VALNEHVLLPFQARHQNAARISSSCSRHMAFRGDRGGGTPSVVLSSELTDGQAMSASLPRPVSCLEAGLFFRRSRWKSITGNYATACKPLRWMIESKRRAGPPGRFTPRSQSDTRLRETLR
jgi:hypothetical protein